MGPAEWTMLTMLSVVWGGSFLLNEIALDGLPVLSVVALRVGGAAIALWLALGSLRLGLPRWAWGPCLVMGVVNNAVPFSLIVWGQTHVTGGTAAILNATTPLFAIVVAHVATSDERMTPARVLGISSGIAGVAIIVGGAAVGASGIAGHLAVLGAAASYGVAGVYGRRFARRGLAPLQIATGQLTGASLVLVPAALVVSGLPAGTPSAYAAVAGLALVCTAFAYILYFRILAASGAVNLLLVTILVPVSAAILGALFLGEALQVRHLAGFTAIAVGLAAIDGRPVALLARRFGHRA
jgi:drug/metabolite transporter (DMT)-like permease